MVELLRNGTSDYYFSDLPPDVPERNELIVLVLENASGIVNNIIKYSEEEIAGCVRELIIRGFLRGTVIDKNKCSWSRPTRRGTFYLELLKKTVINRSDF